MNLDECLGDLNLNELKSIAKMLHRIDNKDPDLSATEYIRRIKDELQNHLLSILAEYVPEESVIMSDLRNLCFGVRKVSWSSKNTLCSLGILYKNDIIPAEIRNTLLVKWRGCFVKTINDPIFEVKPSVLLRFVLILKSIEDGYVKRYEELINLKFSDEFSTKEFVECLIASDFITLDSENTIQIQSKVLEAMRNDKFSFSIDFYEKLFLKNNSALVELLSVLLLIQESDDNWISVKECGSIFNIFNKEVELLLDLGCLLCIEEGNEKCIQLTPDMWYVLTNKKHRLWMLDNVIITPDFQVFVPYFFDPLIIDMLKKTLKSADGSMRCIPTSLTPTMIFQAEIISHVL